MLFLILYQHIPCFTTYKRQTLPKWYFLTIFLPRLASFQDNPLPSLGCSVLTASWYTDRTRGAASCWEVRVSRVVRGLCKHRSEQASLKQPLDVSFTAWDNALVDRQSRLTRTMSDWECLLSRHGLWLGTSVSGQTAGKAHGPACEISFRLFRLSCSKTGGTRWPNMPGISLHIFCRVHVFFAWTPRTIVWRTIWLKSRPQVRNVLAACYGRIHRPTALESYQQITHE